MNPESSRDLLAYSPMFHARLFSETAKYREGHFQPTRSGLAQLPSPDTSTSPEDMYLDGRSDLDRPLTVQFCANHPDELLQAAKYVQPYCDAVDLNLGCPQGIARKGHYGAFLQEDWDLVYKLINKLHNGLGVPVTAKIRILETKEKTLEYARTILSAGASILTVHGRHRDQKGHKTGLADWSIIRYLRENLPADTVLFANGNILRHEDIAKCISATGVDGVMSAEGNLHDPTIFASPPENDDGRTYWRGSDGKGGYRMDAVFRRYLSIIYKHVLESPEPERPPLFIPSDISSSGHLFTHLQDSDNEQPSAKRQKREKTPRVTSPNLTAMQGHLFRLLRPLVSVHTEVRDALARSRPGDIAAFEKVLSLCEAAVKQGLLDYEQFPEKYTQPNVDSIEKVEDEAYSARGTELSDYESSVRAVKACKRPWWVCQPYVRPLPTEAVLKGSITLSKNDKTKLDGEAMSARIQEDIIDKSPLADLSEVTDASDAPARAMVCG